MTRVVINMDAQGLFEVFSDGPIEFYVVCDHCPNDRVYQIEPDVGVEKVRAQLGNDPVGHRNDDQPLGAGYGPRKPPSKPKFEVIK